MSVIKIKSGVLCGVEIYDIEVHALRLKGFSGIQILGLPIDWSRDIRERLRGCLESHGFNPNQQRILIEVKSTVSLKWVRSPPSLLDLPILIGVMHCLKADTRQTKSNPNTQTLFALGEVLLDGEISCKGEEIFLEASVCKQKQDTICYLPAGNYDSCTNEQRNIKIVSHLRDFFSLKASVAAPMATAINSILEPTSQEVEGQGASQIQEQTPASQKSEFSELNSQKIAPQNYLTSPHYNKHLAQLFEFLPDAIASWSKCPALALAHVLALAQRFNLLVVGSPGAGKTHATQCWQHLLPPLSDSQRRDRNLIDGQKKQHWQRPFRSPHHSCSAAGLTGGATLQPGELTLAHHGVLFLDELLEFGRDRLETLREPMESNVIHLAKASGSVTLPAHFQLLACSNPCKCGYLLSQIRACRCPARDRAKAWEKISGPLLDRFELKLVVEDLNEPCSALKALAEFWTKLSNCSKTKQEFIVSFAKLQALSFSLWQTTPEQAPSSVQPSAKFATDLTLSGSRRAIRQEAKILETLTVLFESYLIQKFDRVQTQQILGVWVNRVRNLESVLQKQILGDCP